ncbi:MAG: integrase [Burkholderiales bacterium]|jgi:integrase|nr:integrase [Burkholderiales bacterium]
MDRAIVTPQGVDINNKWSPDPFNEIEQQMIIDTATGQLRNIIQFGFWSGLNINELIALKWADVDFKENVAYICRVKLFGEEREPNLKSQIRTIVLLPRALQALISQIQNIKNSEYIFKNPNTGKHWSSGDFVDNWIDLLSKLDIKYRHFNQMRHTFAATLLSNGEHPAWVSTQLGHENVGVTLKQYERWIPKYNNCKYKFVGNYNC